MDFQVILPFLLPAIASFVAGLFGGSTIPKLLNNKYLKIAIQVVEVLDPVLADNTKTYGESGVRKIIREAILAIADQQLSTAEVSKIIDLTLKLFNPAAAASKPETGFSQKVSEAIARTDGNLANLDLSGIRWKFPVN